MMVILGLAAHALMSGSLAAAADSPVPAVRVDTLPHILSNDNRRPAGRLRNGVLTVRLEARSGTWYPEGSDGLPRAVAAFAEEGRPLQNPGPLIRVPAGTEVRISLRNSLRFRLTLYGLAERRGNRRHAQHDGLAGGPVPDAGATEPIVQSHR